MKTEIIICDICGKPIDYKEHRRFKVKMKEHNLSLKRKSSNFLWDSCVLCKWDDLDVHDECFKEFGRLIASAREQREKDFDEFLKSINVFAEAANKSLL